MESKRNLLNEVRVLMPGRARSHWMLTEAAKSKATLDPKLQALAKKLGTAAFQNGLPMAPVRNPEVMKVIKKLSGPSGQKNSPVSQFLSIYSAAWTQANLAAPVPGIDEATSEEQTPVFPPALYGFWAIRFEDYLKQVTKTKWRFAKNLTVRDGSKIRYKWVGRKAEEEVVAPCFIMLVDYISGKDLYTVETGYVVDGKLKSSKTYTAIYIDQVVDPKVVFQWVAGQWGKGTPVRTEAKSSAKKASVAAKKAFVQQAWAKRGGTTLPKIDPDEYPSIKGMEGPMWIKIDGRDQILYYDPKEGEYYDRKKDLYVKGKTESVVNGQKMPGLDPDKYPPIPGLEGPYHMTVGGEDHVLYYDSLQGAYYDRDTDTYIDDDLEAVESVAGDPAPFQGDQTFSDWKDEVRQQIRAPSWTYPGWALSKENLAETEDGDGALPDEMLPGRQYGGWEPVEDALARLRKSVVS